MNRLPLIVGALLLASLLVAYDAMSTPDICLRGVPQRAIPTDPMVVGDTLHLRAGGLDILLECDNAPPDGVRWASGDTSIVYVDQNGNVVARGPGRANISVRARWSNVSHHIEVVAPR